MKEARHNMLPIEIESELSKDWNIITRHYQHFLPNAEVLCRNAKKFPVSRKYSFLSSVSGLRWNIVISACKEPGTDSTYAFYTLYTNEYGQKGCYTITPTMCEKITPHFFHRLQSRLKKPAPIKTGNFDELVEFYYREVQPEFTFIFENKYMLLRHGIAIVDVAGNDVVTYLTFVSYEMIRDYQTPYKRMAERMVELYEENHQKWDEERFNRIILEEGLVPGNDGLVSIPEFPKRTLTRRPRHRPALETKIQKEREAIRQAERNAKGVPGIIRQEVTKPQDRLSQQMLISPEEIEETIRKLSGRK